VEKWLSGVTRGNLNPTNTNDLQWNTCDLIFLCIRDVMFYLLFILHCLHGKLTDRTVSGAKTNLSTYCSLRALTPHETLSICQRKYLMTFRIVGIIHSETAGCSSLLTERKGHGSKRFSQLDSISLTMTIEDNKKHPVLLLFQNMTPNATSAQTTSEPQVTTTHPMRVHLSL